MSGLRTRSIERTRRHFQHGMSAQANRNASPVHVRSDLQHLLLTIEERHVNRELHAEGVNRL